MNQDNRWHGRGEFPPAGVVCEMWIVGGWNPASIIGIDDQGLCVASVHFDEHRGYRASQDIRDFRPLKTNAEMERDAAIEVMAKATLTPDAGNTISICKLLYDAGWRKPMSRSAAYNAILKCKLDNAGVPIMHKSRNVILDALGYE